MRIVQRPERLRGVRGQAMVEFAIVFPVLILFFLVILQTALLLVSRHMVHYAAFCAARAAIVSPAGNRQQWAQKAATLACLPVIPRANRGTSISDPVSDGLKVIDPQLPKRYALAAGLSRNLVETTLSYNGDDVTAQVVFYYPMLVPMANRVFYEMCTKNSAYAGESAGLKSALWNEGGTKREMLFPFPLKASATLTLEKKFTHGKCCS